VRDKQKLTEELVQLLPDEQRIGATSAMSAWWFNLRKNGGMRLTSTGFDTFVKKLELEHYSYPIDNPMLFNMKPYWIWTEKCRCPTTYMPPKVFQSKSYFLAARKL